MLIHHDTLEYPRMISNIGVHGGLVVCLNTCGVGSLNPPFALCVCGACMFLQVLHVSSPKDMRCRLIGISKLCECAL